MSERGIIKKLTAQAICDAIKTKEGSIEPIPFNEVADRITALPTVSGENKIAQIADKSITELTAADLKGATQIGPHTFRHCISLISVTIPETVTIIGYDAFCFCEKLENVVIPESVTSIRDSAFAECYKLEKITLPSGITGIPRAIFNNAGLTSIIIPNNVTTISSSAFARTKLTTVTIPNSVKSMPDSYTFQGCSKLISVRIGNGIKTINTSAFASCSALTDIYIDKAEGEVTGAPWGATNATIHWNTPLPSEEV